MDAATEDSMKATVIVVSVVSVRLKHTFIRTLCRTRNAGKAFEKVPELGITVVISPKLSYRSSNLISGG